MQCSGIRLNALPKAPSTSRWTSWSSRPAETCTEALTFFERKTTKRVGKIKRNKAIKGFYQKTSLISNYNQQLGKNALKPFDNNDRKQNSASEYSCKNKTYTATSRNYGDCSNQNYFKSKLNSISSQKSFENQGSVERASFKTTIVSRSDANNKAAIKKAVGEKLKSVAGKY